MGPPRARALLTLAVVGTLYTMWFIEINAGPYKLSSAPLLQQSVNQFTAKLKRWANFDAANTDLGSKATTAPASPYKYKLCLLTKIRNMPKLLAEWLEYHALMGVEQVFLADDCSDDQGQTRLIMELYQRAGLVTGYSKLPFNDCVNRHPDGGKLYSHVLKDAKDQCEWIGAMDVDEYMTLQEDLHPGTLHSLLDESILPVVRMPWSVVGSNGHETAPPGLLIEGFVDGSGDMGKFIKTLVKSNIITDWRFSHWPDIVESSERTPPPPQAETDFLNATDSATSDYPLKHWMERIWVSATDKRKVDVDGQSCIRPVQALFLKHYQFLSWEQFMEYRGKRATNAEGSPEPNEDNRGRWQAGTFTATPCTSPARNFTLAMATKVKVSMASRSGPWLEPYLQTYEGVIR